MRRAPSPPCQHPSGHALAAELAAAAPWLLAYAACGAVIGFLAGLLGIGGGMTLVPLLAALFTAQQLSSEHTLHLALGTAMASVMFTSTASVREHHRLGSVDWTWVRNLAPAMALGALASTFASGWLPQRVLALAFAVIVFIAATQIWIGRPAGARQLVLGTAGRWAAGLAIGVVSGLVSAGGTFLSMPFMMRSGVPVRTAIGTAAAIGVPVAVVGSVGYVAGGWSVPALPAGALGFVLLPAMGAVVAASVFTAPMGARLAHRLPVVVLRRVFAVSLYAIAARMAWAYYA